MKKVLSLVLAAIAAITMTAALTSCKQEKKIVTIGYTLYDPMNYEDENGELIGFDTDLAKAVFENLGYEPVFKLIDWKNKYVDLNSGTIDCVWNGFTANAKDDDGIERSAKVDFSYNYMENQQVIVIKDGTAIATAADLKDKNGAVEGGSAGETYAKGFEGANIKGLPYQTDALMEVNAGTADFAVVDVLLAKSMCGKGDYANLKMVDALASDVEFYAIGFKKGSELTANVNAQLEALAADGTITKIAKEYGVENTAIIDYSNQK